MRPSWSICAVLLAGSALVTGCEDGELPEVDAPETVRVSSKAIADGEPIPERYTCDGDNTSPDLHWTVPEGAEGFALTVTDPDAPGGDFVHWVVFDIPASVSSIADGDPPQGAAQGRSDFGDDSYGGPCPPEGDDAHRYVFTIYALGKESIDVASGAPAAGVLEAIACCVIAKGTLTATYAR